jgi:hypothetical protein
MATGNTAIWGRPHPLESDTPDVAADITALANSLETVPLYPTAAATSRTGVVGEGVVVSPSQTLTLPATPTQGDALRIVADGTVTGSTPVTVAASGSKVINGKGLSSGSSFLLGTPHCHATVQYDGTAWRIIDGQQDSGWVAIALGGGVSVGGGVTPAARHVGDKVELCGELVGAGITAWGTVPFHPPATAYLESLGALQVSAAGAISTNGTSSVYLDGKSYRAV